MRYFEIIAAREPTAPEATLAERKPTKPTGPDTAGAGMRKQAKKLRLTQDMQHAQAVAARRVAELQKQIHEV